MEETKKWQNLSHRCCVKCVSEAVNSFLLKCQLCFVAAAIAVCRVLTQSHCIQSSPVLCMKWVRASFAMDDRRGRHQQHTIVLFDAPTISMKTARQHCKTGLSPIRIATKMVKLYYIKNFIWMCAARLCCSSAFARPTFDIDLVDSDSVFFVFVFPISFHILFAGNGGMRLWKTFLSLLQLLAWSRKMREFVRLHYANNKLQNAFEIQQRTKYFRRLFCVHVSCAVARGDLYAIFPTHLCGPREMVSPSSSCASQSVYRYAFRWACFMWMVMEKWSN